MTVCKLLGVGKEEVVSRAYLSLAFTWGDKVSHEKLTTQAEGRTMNSLNVIQSVRSRKA
jgi:hypothetical protein